MKFERIITVRGVLSKWEFFIKMRAAFLAPILPQVMMELEESKEGRSHFDTTVYDEPFPSFFGYLLKKVLNSFNRAWYLLKTWYN